VIQGASLLGAAEGAAGLWGEDRVHLTNGGYQHCAKGKENVIEEMWESEVLTMGPSKKGGPEPKRVKYDLAQARPDWVRKNIGEAERREESFRG